MSFFGWPATEGQIKSWEVLYERAIPGTRRTRECRVRCTYEGALGFVRTLQGANVISITPSEGEPIGCDCGDCPQH